MKTKTNLQNATIVEEPQETPIVVEEGSSKQHEG